MFCNQGFKLGCQNILQIPGQSDFYPRTASYNNIITQKKLGCQHNEFYSKKSWKLHYNKGKKYEIKFYVSANLYEKYENFLVH